MGIMNIKLRFPARNLAGMTELRIGNEGEDKEMKKRVAFFLR
jgi:hypothetical protein